MRVRSFSHVALTVSDFNRTVRFYSDVFGAPVVGVSDTPSERVRSFFGVDAPAPTCKIGWIRVPGGATIEIFEFQPQQPPIDVLWNRIGATHISFNVHDTQKWHDYLVAKGVQIVSPPEKSPHGHTFFFVKDPDGNLVELIDNKHMRAVLRWLGPLGGVVFRHTMYKKYYRPSERETRVHTSPGD
jgi:catechol 2,3-dioxygenase-like lactoylglutathione lyase family enzyme